jgi:hypothetical protein
MKKQMLAAAVAGLIIFLWQFLSWALLGLHKDMQQHTPKQEEVLKFLGENLEEGFYYLPTTPPAASPEEEQKLMENSMGKPWAQVYYHKSLNINMGMSMARGFFTNMLAMWILIWILSNISHPSRNVILFSTLGIGLIGFSTGTYTQSIWFEHRVMMDLLDTLVSFGAVGLWLGWWLRK